MKMECIRRLLSLNDVDMVQCTQLNRIFVNYHQAAAVCHFFAMTHAARSKREQKDVFCLCIGMRLHGAPLFSIDAIKCGLFDKSI